MRSQHPKLGDGSWSARRKKTAGLREKQEEKRKVNGMEDRDKARPVVQARKRTRTGRFKRREFARKDT